MKYVSIALVLLLALAMGCASAVYEGKKIDAMKVKQMVPGGTKVEAVEGAFGKPQNVEKLPSGGEAYIYVYRIQNPHWWTMGGRDSQRLEVVIKDGVVQTYKFREEGQEAYLKD